MKRLTPSAARRRKSESGSILGMSAIAMLAILGAVGLGIDISHMYLAAAELQNAADAAALAGASALNGGAGGIAVAVDRAVVAMNRYEFNHTAVGVADADVTFAATVAGFDSGGTSYNEAGASAAGVAPTIKFVRVRIPAKTISTVVARAFLQASQGAGGGTVSEFAVSRSAVAGQSVGLNGVCNFVPFTIVQDGVTNLPLENGTTCGNLKVFTKGCTYKVPLGSSGNTISAGEFLLLTLTNTRGGSDIRRLMGIGVDLCARVGDIVTLDTTNGTKAGPVRQGLNTRFDDFQGAGAGITPADFPPDTNVKSGITYTQYKSGSTSSSVFQAPQNSPAQADRRVLILPIINASSYVKATKQVTIASFGAFFMTKPVTNGANGLVIIEYIGTDIVIGNGSYDPNGGPGIQGLTVPVLYR